jgi:large subunit ribosomal protein L17
VQRASLLRRLYIMLRALLAGGMRQPPRLPLQVAPTQPCVRAFRVTARMGRAMPQRVSMLRNMVTSLIQHERIKTGHVKAKQVARLADKLVTAAKAGRLTSHRWAARWVMTKSSLAKLFTTLGARYQQRAGGYTRVLKTYPRMGDAAPMAFVEFVDRPQSQMKIPWSLPEQPSSVVPGRGGRSFRAGKRQMNDEIL